MGRTIDSKIISLKSRRNKKKFKKLYAIFENLKSKFFSKKNEYSPEKPLYKKPANN